MSHLLRSHQLQKERTTVVNAWTRTRKVSAVSFVLVYHLHIVFGAEYSGEHSTGLASSSLAKKEQTESIRTQTRSGAKNDEWQSNDSVP